jgi:alpha-glucuronidase
MNTNTELIIPQIDYSQTDLQIRNIIEKVVTYMPKVNRQIIEAEIMRAYKYSKDAHD